MSIALAVLDTNLVLDLLVFDDPACVPLREALARSQLRWIATAAMREELARVLGYPLIVTRLERTGRTAAEVLAVFDSHAQELPPAPAAPCRCEDPDDQVFIDLAVAHGARLLSKDRAVLVLRKALAELGVKVSAHFGEEAEGASAAQRP